MTVPAHVCRALSCDAGVDRERFAAHLESLNDDLLPWFLLDQAARDALVQCIFDADDPIELNVLDVAETVESVGYLEIGSVQGDLRFLLKIPSDTSPRGELPTGALVSLTRVWPKVPDLLDEADTDRLNEKYCNKLVVLSVNDPANWDRENFAQLTASLLGCRLHAPGNSPGVPLWVGFGRIEIDPAGIAAQPALMSGRLLQEVLSEKRIRWRYIALYRVLEAAYLIGLKESLLVNFLDGPKDALSKAQAALESELSTFKKLVDDKNLGANFDSIRAIVDGDNSNRFLSAIKRSLKASKSSGANTGVEYAYKIRCAIVHAGQHDVVFDRFPDGEQGVGMLLHAMEGAVLQLLGLRRV